MNHPTISKLDSLHLEIDKAEGSSRTRIAHDMLRLVAELSAEVEAIPVAERGDNFDYFCEKLNGLEAPLNEMLTEDGDEAAQRHWIECLNNYIVKIKIFTPIKE